MRIGAFACLSLFAVAACAATEPSSRDNERGEVVLGGCRQGECGWLRVVRVEGAGTFPQGELKRMAIRRGTSLHPDGNIPERASDARIEWQAADRSEYAFCSTQRPAYAFPDEEGGLVVHFLDLHDLGGYQMGSARLYMRFCHGREGLPEAEVVQSLGYRPGTRSEQVENGTPETLTSF